MKRSPKVMLSRTEANALRHLSHGRANGVRRQLLELLLSMGLVRVGDDGRLKLAEDGLRWLSEGREDCLPTAAKSNPFSPTVPKKNPFDPND